MRHLLAFVVGSTISLGLGFFVLPAFGAQPAHVTVELDETLSTNDRVTIIRLSNQCWIVWHADQKAAMQSCDCP